MYKKVVVLALCSLLLISAIDCKKVKDAKKVKEPKVKKEKQVIVEKPVEVVEVQKAVVVEEPVAEQVPEEIVEEPKTRPIITPPKSLKVLSAYEQCKMECKRQRDAIQASEYVEQLRQELAAAEAALAAEGIQQDAESPIAPENNANPIPDTEPATNAAH